MNKHGWTFKKLGDLTDTINGLWTGKKPPFVNVAVVRNTNFTKDCKLDMTNVAFLDVEEKQYATRKLYPGDIIIEKSGGSDKQPVGRPVLFNISHGEYSFSNFTSTLRINNNKITPTFLHIVLYAKYLQGITFRMQSKTTGIHNLDFKAYKKLEIPVPPMDEQEAIVAELDEINEAIAEMQQQIADLDTLAQSTFYDMFGDPVTNPKGWEVKKLEEVVSKKCSISYGIVQPGEDFSNGIPVVRPVDLVNHFVTQEGLKKVKPSISESYKRTILKGNEILLCVRGTTGVMSFASTELNGCNVTRGITPLYFDENVSKYFVFHVLSSKYVQDLIAEKTRGIALKQINMKDVRELPIILPPLALQQEFAIKVEATEAAKAELNAQIAEMQTLLASRMDYYFD